jgi:hypothetical protein
MSDEYKFPQELQNLIIKALPEDTSLHGKTPELRYTYLPAAHVKALRPDSSLVVGIRGAGKSFWWAALQQEAHRDIIAKQTGFSDRTITSTGFGEKSSPDNYPGKDVISSLMKKFEPRRIWQTVVLRHVAGDKVPAEFVKEKTWESRVEWLQSNPEFVERCLFNRDNELQREDRFHLILFDALDRTADDWKTMHALVRGLLQVLLDFRSYSRIRLKAFVRPDQIEDPEVAAFPDSSKILSKKTELYWPRPELYGLFWQYLSNEDSNGQLFREGSKRITSADWIKNDDVWIIPEVLRNNEGIQRKVFHAMTGPWMGRDRRRGFPYTWLPNHLGDARREVSPRSFLAALRHAAEDKVRDEQEYGLHYESIKRGVQEASKIRVQEIQEDYPWVQKLIKPLSGISVPCSIKEVKAIWDENKVLEHLENSIAAAGVRLPPTHIERGAEGVLDDLINLGLIERISDDRINLPDVYRVGYGIGRRGGVKPVARRE